VRVPLASTLLGGVLLGALWRVVAPLAARLSDRAETAAAADGSFFLLAALAGLITAILLHRRPGRSPARRFLVVFAASAVASPLAVGLCMVTGGPRLVAWGGLAVWPLVVAAGVLVLTAQSLVSGGDQVPTVDRMSTVATEKVDQASNDL